MEKYKRLNDGSKDGSLALARKLAERYAQIVVVDQPNGGVSSARNAGLRICKGDYVTFVDSDDSYVDDAYLSNMVSAMDGQDVDLVISGFVVIGKQGKRYVDAEKRTVSRKELAENFSQYQKTELLNSPCNKLFRRNLIQSKFDQQMTMGEDAVFVLSYLHNCKKVAFCPGCGYGYVFMNSSSTADFRKNCAYDLQQTRIYHSAFRDFWAQNLSEKETAVNYIEMYTEAVYRMMRSVLQKQGICGYITHRISPILEDPYMKKYRHFSTEVPSSYPYYPLMKHLIRQNGFATY